MPYAFDPELAPYVELLPTRETGDIEATRAFVADITKASLARADVTGLRIEDRAVPGAVGAPDVCVRIYAPETGSGPCGGVLYIHGGGFTVGSIDMEQAQAAHLAREVG